MFDIGFAELVIIAVVALLVIGPERLPDAVRTASAWLNRFRRSFNEIKQEVQQELHNDAVMRELRESGEKLRRETEALRQDLNSSTALGSEAPVPPDPSTAPEPAENNGSTIANSPIATSPIPTSPVPTSQDAEEPTATDESPAAGEPARAERRSESPSEPGP